ncbi:Mu transposase C-terminal domain-containing protein [Flexivirga oryzae]|uniref:Mu transposase C-terminal domain-containing protein n=1 Tax=Flexivirga oryzae TaxID=1794944 RepID=UPI0031B57C5C
MEHRVGPDRSRPRDTQRRRLTEAFLWSQVRTVTKTATVSLHGNSYQVEAALVGRKVELVFSPFDLEHIHVRYDGRCYGPALPQVITRHAHPKAKPETPEPETAPSTGIAYLNLVTQAHHAGLADDPGIGFNALYSRLAGDGGGREQVPGHTSIEDFIDAPDHDDAHTEHRRHHGNDPTQEQQ